MCAQRELVNKAQAAALLKSQSGAPKETRQKKSHKKILAEELR